MTFTERPFWPFMARKGSKATGDFRRRENLPPLGGRLWLGAPGAPRHPALRDRDFRRDSVGRLAGRFVAWGPLKPGIDPHPGSRMGVFLRKTPIRESLSEGSIIDPENARPPRGGRAGGAWRRRLLERPTGAITGGSPPATAIDGI